MGPAKQRPQRPREHRRGRGLLWLVRGEVRVGVPLIASGLDSNPWPDKFSYLLVMSGKCKHAWLISLLWFPVWASAQTPCPLPSSFCGVGTVWDDQSQTCVVGFPSDSDFDGCVQLSDLLNLLSAFGSCNDDCVGGCELPNATSVCEDGICVVASCNAGFIDFNGLADDGCEEEEVPAFVCGGVVEHGGHSYATIEIGGQCWFSENLRSTLYANGDVIPSTLTDSQWNNANAGATTIYGEDDGCTIIRRTSIRVIRWWHWRSMAGFTIGMPLTIRAAFVLRDGMCLRKPNGSP